MESLVLANIKHRPVRVLVTSAGVAVGTVLILLIVGLAHGIARERGERESNMASELMVRPAGTFTIGLSANLLSMPIESVEKLRSIPGVKAAAPVGAFVQSTESGIGFRAVDGVDFNSYQETVGIKLIEGSLPVSDDELIVDEERARSNKEKPGDALKVLDRTFKITGVYSPPVGARIKVRLSMLQDMLSSQNKCTMMLVRCSDPAQQDETARRIAAVLPDTQIIFTRDLPKLYSEGIPAVNLSLKVLVGLAVFISTLVILLAMYTAISERTREIGVLKSLGASRSFIIWAIEKEALTISAIGLAIGYAVAFASRFLLVRFTTLRNIEFEADWLLVTAAVGVAAGLLGALYPALRASLLDPVEALSYE